MLSSSAGASTFDGPRVLVHFSASVTPEARAAAIDSVGGSVDALIPELGVTRVALRTGANAAGAVDALEGQAGVASVERDDPVRLSFTPNDTYYLRDPYSGLGQWDIKIAGIDRAWDVVRGSPNVIVATIDTGVDAGHPDLAGVLLPGVAFVSSPSAGCGTKAADDNSHGTHVAGIIGANGNNSLGIAGVAYGVKVLPLKALDCTGAGTTSDVAQAIVYAAEHGARIINISLGSTNSSATLQTAVRYARAKDALVIVAAGNCGIASPRCGMVNEINYPAAYPEVLAVAATQPDDTRAPFSTQAGYVGVAAPGLRIVSTMPTYPTYVSQNGGTTGYGVFSGTSQAAPIVSGVAALVLSKEPNLSADQLDLRLRATADDLGPPGVDTSFGAGRVNAFRAVGGTTAAPIPVAAPDAAPRGAAASFAEGGVPTLLPGGRASLPVTVKNEGTTTWLAGGASPVRAAVHLFDAKGETVVWDGARTILTSDVAPGASVPLNLRIDAPLRPGIYRARPDLVVEGVAWFSSLGSQRAADTTVVVVPDYGATLSTGPVTVSRANPVAPVTVTNVSSAFFSSTAYAPVLLSLHWLDAGGKVLLWDGPRTRLPSDLGPRETATVTVALGVIPPGATQVTIDLVAEGVSWFGVGAARPVVLAP